MAITRHRTGLVTVKFAAPAGGSLVNLGYNTDMTEVQERQFYHNVPGDQNGGPQGPPIEIQWLGSMAIINCNLSSWDDTNLDLLRKIANATAGKILQSEVGTFMFVEKSMRLTLDCDNRPRNFPNVILREPIGYGMGTKYTAHNIVFEAHKTPESGHPLSGTKAGVLWDTDVA